MYFIFKADVSAEVCNLSPFNLIILGNGIRQYVSQHSSTIIAELMVIIFILTITYIAYEQDL